MEACPCLYSHLPSLLLWGQERKVQDSMRTQISEGLDRTSHTWPPVTAALISQASLALHVQPGGWVSVGSGVSTPALPCRPSYAACFFSTATRESAFVHAIASAGVAFAVTRSCAEGAAAICGCSNRHQGSPGEGWKWGGCSEDIEFGGMVSREFADARENRPDARSAMNRHNNEAGRQVHRGSELGGGLASPCLSRPGLTILSGS